MPGSENRASSGSSEEEYDGENISSDEEGEVVSEEYGINPEAVAVSQHSTSPSLSSGQDAISTTSTQEVLSPTTAPRVSEPYHLISQYVRYCHT